MATLQLFACPQFLETFDQADIGLQHQVRRTLQDMVNRFYSNSARVWTQYQLFGGFVDAAKNNGINRIIEVEICGSVRLLAGVSGPNLYLLDFGYHDIEQRWDRIKTKPQWVKSRKTSARLANDLLKDSDENPFISLSECDGWVKHYEGEDTSAWVSFLDTVQHETTIEITSEIEDHIIAGKRDYLLLILGGPGTGKTVVLLKILEKLLAAKLNVGFSCSDAVCNYLESSTGCIIPRWDPTQGYDVLLFDDPSNLEQLLKRPQRDAGQSPRALVYAFDPLQLTPMPSAAELDRVIQKTKAKVYELNICYRQRQRLAAKVTEMTDNLANSSPFLDKDKVANFAENYSDLLRRFNKPESSYPLGDFKSYIRPSTEVFTQRIEALTTKPGLWTHTPPFLIVFDTNLKDKFQKIFELIEDDNQFKVIWSNQIEDIKGIDYQHVIVFLAQGTFDALQKPFHGSGRATFNGRRLLRIPFSRARDSLSLFIW
jgi:hypothetical protein